MSGQTMLGQTTFMQTSAHQAIFTTGNLHNQGLINVGERFSQPTVATGMKINCFFFDN